MRKLIIAILFAIPVAAFAQSGRINIDIPQSLAAHARESVDVTLEGPTLRLASRFLGSEDKDVRDLIEKVEGIYVHNYEFNSEGAYDRSIVDSVRRQLGPEWKRIVSVKGWQENTEVYTLPHGDSFAGLVVLVAEPREFTVINIVGPIDLDKLASLKGQFGIPRDIR